MNTEYLGEWRSKAVYQPTRALPTRWLTPQVYKCAACKIKWFRAITNWYEGMCYWCWKEQFDETERADLNKERESTKEISVLYEQSQGEDDA